jgi:Ca2+-transporting ATPase
MTALSNIEPAQQAGTNGAEPDWYVLTPAETSQRLGTDVDHGLTSSEVAARQQRYGRNELGEEKKPSAVAIAFAQVRDPMNIMLLAVTAISLVIGEFSTALIVGLLVLLNVVLGARQELKAQASVDALAKMQIPQARVVRDGQLAAIPATEVVPGDVVNVEAGDIVVADGRIVRSANLETQEAALTGESTPVSKGVAAVDAGAALGDRTDLLFQNTSVTRGTGTIVVTATGMHTEVGKIAGLLQSVDRTKSPLQKQLDGLTKWLGMVAWIALLVVVLAGLARGLDFKDLMLLGTAMAISAIPTGMPTFVQGMLSYGARELAEAKAVVRNLSDVETLGSTSAINTDKTGTLTLNQMTAVRLYVGGEWFSVEGGGYSKNGNVLGEAGTTLDRSEIFATALALASDATVSDDGTVVGDPTEAALVVLAAKLGVDAGITRAALPRLSEVPFDSAYKYMATFHDYTPPEGGGAERIVEVVKGAPDVLLDHSSRVLWRGQEEDIAAVRDHVLAANSDLSSRGLRVLALAYRRFPLEVGEAISVDPQSFVDDLVLVGLIGIIDPLRSEAKAAVTAALGAGIDVRMITGDHAITAKAIADQLGLGPGVITGAEFAALSDEEAEARLPALHVFGRVSPEDKLRLVTLMESEGLVVAMTGDAVNDAAALKKADVGVAMGSGSEVSKQAAKMVLTDDNFATLVHAIELGRDIYHKITAYIRYQMSQLFGLVSLFLLAAIFDVNKGVALQPAMAIFLNFFVAVFPVAAIMTDVTDPTLMQQKPRDPSVPIFNRHTGPRWVGYGIVLGVVSLIPLIWGPGSPSIEHASVSQTMAFCVMGLATIFSGFVMRSDTQWAFQQPLLKFATILGAGALIVVFSTQFGFLQRWLLTTSLSAREWAAVLGLSLVMPVVVEIDKALQRRHAARVAAVPAASVTTSVTTAAAA